MNEPTTTNKFRPKFRHAAFFTLLICSLFVPSWLRAGGNSNYDEPDCDCGGMFDSYDEPEPARVLDEVPPAECVPYVQRDIRAAILKLPAPKPCPICQTCPVAQPVLSESTHALVDSMTPKTTQSMHPSQMSVAAKPAAETKTFEVIKTVKVKKGWWVALYVKKSAKQGADYAATRACNGFSEPNPLVLPGQVIKICRWK